jgi:hypothetical protein
MKSVDLLFLFRFQKETPMNHSLNIQLLPFLKKTALRRGAIFGSILVTALLAFEVFNFGTTTYALRDMLGDLKFAGISWASILAVAFCGIDFAGIARIFTPEQGRNEPAEVYYLFGAWLLAAAFNATLTWWGVSVAIMNHSHNASGSAIVGQATMTTVVPIFVAAMVWLIRVLIIGTFSVAGERLFTLADAGVGQSSYRNEPVRAYNPAPKPQPQPQPYRAPQTNVPVNMPINAPSMAFHPAPKPKPTPNFNTPVNRVEPTYHPIGMSAMSGGESHTPSVRR